jgi:predicted enzyme involved in methoxymalonyl-ACP biosynthesis
MGRTVERAFLAVVARELGATHLVGEFRPTNKNLPVRELYAEFGFQQLQRRPDGDLWERDLVAAPLVAPPWFEIELVGSKIVA